MNSVRVTTLDTGVRVASDAMAGVETVTVGVWVGVGTRNEHAEVNGVAHLAEHMLFKGTPRRSAFAISEQIERVGGHLNAYTTREHTAYYAKVLAEDLTLAVDIIADMIQNALLDERELERERAVVLQEIGQAIDTPDDIVFDQFQTTAFPDQALGRPVLGSTETVGALDRSSLVAYLGRHYGTNSIIVTAAGKVDHDRLVALASSLFGGLEPRDDGVIEPARYQGGEYREARDLEQLHLVLGFKGVSVHDPDFYAHTVMTTLLGGGMSSRLFQEVREVRGLAYSIYSFSGSYRDEGLFGIYAGTGPGEAAELVPVLCDTVVGLPDSLTEDEVARARAQLRAGTLMSMESTMARCEQLGQHLLTFGRPIPVGEIVARIEEVSLPAVRRTVERLLASRPTVAALGPLAALEPFERIAARLG